MRSMLFKTLSILALAFTLGACSADSDVKDDGDPRPGNPNRKPSQEEMARIMKVIHTMDGMDAVEYPIGRAFGNPDAGENPVGEKMFALLKDCTVKNTQTDMLVDQSLNGTCPVDYKKAEQFKKDGDNMTGESQEFYNVTDAAYVLDGHMLSYQMFGKSEFVNGNIKLNLGGAFRSQSQGDGQLQLGFTTTSTPVSETRANFVIINNLDLYLSKGLCADEKKSSCLSGIKLSLEIKGYVEVVGEEIKIITESMACFLDGVEFNCNAEPKFKKLQTASLKTARTEVVKSLK